VFVIQTARFKNNGHKMRLVLFQPDIPQNLGSAIRLSACLGVNLDIIEPCGFALNDKAIKRAAMDYGPCANVSRHVSFDKFKQFRDLEHKSARLILFTTKSAAPYADVRLYIPMQSGARSLNVINAAAMALGEALRQTHGFADSHLLA
jgi:tRNA (cytidine/uridine-2'-O-)-methyltransferase